MATMKEFPSHVDPKSWLSRFREWISTHLKTEWEVRFPLGKIIPKTRLGWFIAFLLALSAAYASFVFYHEKDVPKKPKDVPKNLSIAVFYPDPTLASQGPFFQDGVVQIRGFNEAVSDAASVPNRLKVHYHELKSSKVSAEELIEGMKKLYTEERATFFVMTMSGTILRVRDSFKAWHQECVQLGQREPVLIATVASAPNIADASSGILRWYVRSEEESSLLACYLRWKERVDRAVVFYITLESGHDPYGKRGMEVFRDRFTSSYGGISEDFFAVSATDATTAKTAVEKFRSKYPDGDAQSKEHLGVFIVGYGDMVRETLNELLKQGFDGPIVCASTLTEPDWQPQETIADSRIFTVRPRMSNPQDKLLPMNDRNIVFFFAKETLRRVLELTAIDQNPRSFIEKWKCDDKKSGLDQELLANGDTIVQLDVVGSEYWRREKASP